MIANFIPLSRIAASFRPVELSAILQASLSRGREQDAASKMGIDGHSAEVKGVMFPTFVTYTDSETWVGNIHPAQALRQYRDESVGDAKAVVVGKNAIGARSHGYCFPAHAQ